jgi:hypothetical protein
VGHEAAQTIATNYPAMPSPNFTHDCGRAFARAVGEISMTMSYTSVAVGDAAHELAHQFKNGRPIDLAVFHDLATLVHGGLAIVGRRTLCQRAAMRLSGLSAAELNERLAPVIAADGERRFPFSAIVALVTHRAPVRELVDA